MIKKGEIIKLEIIDHAFAGKIAKLNIKDRTILSLYNTG